MKYVLVEHLNRSGDVVECGSEMAGRPAARVYHFHSTLELVIVKKGWVDGLVGEISGRMGVNSVDADFGENARQCGKDCGQDSINSPHIRIPPIMFRMIIPLLM